MTGCAWLGSFQWGSPIKPLKSTPCYSQLLRLGRSNVLLVQPAIPYCSNSRSNVLHLQRLAHSSITMLASAGHLRLWGLLPQPYRSHGTPSESLVGVKDKPNNCNTLAFGSSSVACTLNLSSCDVLQPFRCRSNRTKIMPLTRGSRRSFQLAH